MMEEDKKLLHTEEGNTYEVEIPDTVEIPVIENPDDREYENVKIEVEGGI